MAEQKLTSSLSSRLGARIAEAHEAAKDLPVEYGNARLPELEDGVAQLVHMGFAEHTDGDNKGKPYFQARGVCVCGGTAGDTVVGRQTSLFIPLYDTPNRKTKPTFGHHWADFLNVFKQFGVDMPPGIRPGESREAASNRQEQYFFSAMNILTQQKPHFMFRVWKGKKATTGPYANKEPMSMEEWLGVTQWVADGQSNGQAAPVDNSAMAPQAPVMPPVSTVMTAAPFVEPPQATPIVQTQAAPVQPPTQPPVAVAAVPAPSPAFDPLAAAEVLDMDQEMVTDDAQQAMPQLSAWVRSQGVTDEEATKFANWTDLTKAVLANSIGSGRGAAAPTASAQAAPKEIAKGVQVTYQGQPCEVTSINGEAKTATLKNLATTKPVVDGANKLLKIPFDQLS